MDTSNFERFRQGPDSLPAGKKSLSILLMAGVAALAACSGDKAPEQAPPPAPAPAAPVAAEPAPSTEAPATGEEVGTQLAVSEALTVPELLDLAKTAVSEKQLFVPPGQSAFEYYLRVVELAPDNLTAHNALIDFYPYALLYVEQRVAASDLVESERVLGLMQKADDGAPALPRLLREVTALRARKAAENEAREQAQLAAQQRAAAAAAAPIAVAEPATTPPQVVEEPPQPVRTAPPPQPVATIPEPVPEPVAPPPRPVEPSPAASVASGLPSVISSVQPRYPPAAFRRRVSGSVEVGFTVLPDGSVTGVRVISAKPPNVFDREAINAMERWRFAPSNRTSEGRRIFDFKME